MALAPLGTIEAVTSNLPKYRGLGSNKPRQHGRLKIASWFWELCTQTRLARLASSGAIDQNCYHKIY